MTTDDRYDIDLGEYLRGLAHWWWVIVLLAALGAVVGAAVTVTHHKTYLATSSVYMGQPTDANANSISAVNTDPRAAVQLGTAQATLVQVARQIGRGETAGRLRAGVSVVSPPPATKAATAPINIVAIGVHDINPVRAAAAANAIAGVIVDRLGAYNTGKIALLTTQVAADSSRLAILTARNDAAQRALDAIAAGGGTAATKAMASAPYLSTAPGDADEMQTLLSDRRFATLGLLVARGVEAPAVLAPAAAPASPEPSGLSLNTAVGLLVGLVVGLLTAALLEWRRRAPVAA